MRQRSAEFAPVLLEGAQPFPSILTFGENGFEPPFVRVAHCGLGFKAPLQRADQLSGGTALRLVVSSNFHCSIVGTCLTTAELRHILTKIHPGAQKETDRRSAGRQARWRRQGSTEGARSAAPVRDHTALLATPHEDLPTPLARYAEPPRPDQIVRQTFCGT